MTDNNKYKILIIEDEALVARELRSRLTNMGYEVVGVAYSREGIDLARETSPDLLLTDIHLKDGEDGIRLAREIQQERDVPVVFLTAYSDEATVARAKAVAPYGYIIKPVENRELHIAIEIAVYKFRIERELREAQQLLQTALTCIGRGLLFVGPDAVITRVNADAEEIFQVSRGAMIGRPWNEVLGLDQDSSVGRKISMALESQEVTKLAPFIVNRKDRLPCLVDGIVGPMEDGAVMIVRELSEINDPVEMLPAPDQLLAELGAEQLTPSESSMCQLLIAAEAGGVVPELIVSRVTSLLHQMLRSTDLVSRYGDNQIAVSMPYTSVEEGRQIAASLLKSLKTQDFKGETVNFSIGLSSTIPGDQQPFELFRRASWALNIARESGGNRVIQWSDAAERPADAGGSESARHREYHNLVL
ncbi:MAG TPA: response regulator, partial [Pseudomonadales bacterium]|nr:response regulator [Pseudomonadales bacterium]